MYVLYFAWPQDVGILPSILLEHLQYKLARSQDAKHLEEKVKTLAWKSEDNL